MRTCAILAVAALLACGGGSSPLQAQYQPQITNAPDSFAFQLTGVLDGGGTFAYAWRNTGASATIDRSSSISGGSVMLTLRDAGGAVVYQAPLEGVTGSTATAAGAPGDWTVTVEFTHATGTVNFRAQRQ